MKTTRVIARVALALASTLVLQLALAQQPGVHRTELQRHDMSVPGWEAVEVRIDIDPGMIVPNHKHPGEEVVYVLHGSLEYRLEGSPPAMLKAGDSLFIPKGVVHNVKNVGSDNASEVSTYIVEKGKPLAEPVK
ncbi:cupin domain-containing protein [Rhodanobacter sp. MP7CTX1]|uniref:cupin domain-containing protein n=1 Tax=Rhodanobacter sp. MP7CTX1 TaxID=2723084 RepID=UPI001616DA20|nr:cupin domain-containing protein [Rhodanobacter sp. MP7CTX1]MBB6189151.1 quercetin dioxygenase-like cupin family protein [Rhodanobacter sp. MP7CTX1]